MGLNAVSIDTRIKATVTSTIYDMSRLSANGYFDAMSEEDRYKLKESIYNQRIKDFKMGVFAKARGLSYKFNGEDPQFVKDYYDC